MSTPAEELPIEHRFDAVEFWLENQTRIIAGALALLIGVIAYAGYEINSARNAAKAQAALANAASIEQLQAVAKDFPGSAAAGNATLLFAGKLRGDKKFDDAIAALREFIEKNPTHPQAAGALLSIGSTLEAQGKDDDALETYQQIVTKYNDSYAAPFALLAQANLQRSKGKFAEARRSYESIISLYPESFLAPQAMQEMKMLKK